MNKPVVYITIYGIVNNSDQSEIQMFKTTMPTSKPWACTLEYLDKFLKSTIESMRALYKKNYTEGCIITKEQYDQCVGNSPNISMEFIVNENDVKIVQDNRFMKWSDF